MTARRPAPKATPRNTTSNRVLHYAALSAIVIALAVVAVAVL